MSLALLCLELGQPRLARPAVFCCRLLSSDSSTTAANAISPTASPSALVVVGGKSYARDNFTNVTPRILSHLGRNLHLRPQHPLGLVLVCRYQTGRSPQKVSPYFLEFESKVRWVGSIWKISYSAYSPYCSSSTYSRLHISESQSYRALAQYALIIKLTLITWIFVQCGDTGINTTASRKLLFF